MFFVCLSRPFHGQLIRGRIEQIQCTLRGLSSAKPWKPNQTQTQIRTLLVHMYVPKSVNFASAEKRTFSSAVSCASICIQKNTKKVIKSSPSPLKQKPQIGQDPPLLSSVRPCNPPRAGFHVAEDQRTPQLLVTTACNQIVAMYFYTLCVCSIRIMGLFSLRRWMHG